MDIRVDIKNIYLNCRLTRYLKLLISRRNNKFIRNIYFLMEPEHDNIGDQAISYAQRKFLESNLPNYNIIQINEREFNDYSRCFQKIIRNEDIICLIGGGNMGDEYIHHENTRRKIISLFPNNKIISFPQTMHFKNNEKGNVELNNTRKVYNNHNNLVLIAREEISYQKMKNNFINNKIILTPDIVLSLNKTDNNVNRNGALLCLRNDKEAIITDSDKENIYKIVKRYYGNIINTDMREGKEVKPHEREGVVEKKLQQFKSAELVITDRLHGMIFSAITSTPCIVFSNYNHKILGSYEWIKDLGFIRLAKNVSDVENILRDLKKVKNYSYNNSNLIKYYDLILKEITEDIHEQ